VEPTDYFLPGAILGLLFFAVLLEYGCKAQWRDPRDSRLRHRRLEENNNRSQSTMTFVSVTLG